MKVGLFLGAQFQPDISARRGLDEIVEQARLAEELGFHSVFLGHHYLARSSFLQPLSLAGYLARATERVRIGFGVLLAPLLNPLELAEELATLDVLSGGRMIAGFGAGYRKVECEAFGVEWADRVVRLREYVPILRALWAGEQVSASGSWGTLEQAELRLRPVQEGGPPIWLGALAAGGIRRAARLGATWLIGPEGDNDDLGARLALYRDELREHGHGVDRPYPLMREAAIADTTEEAVGLIRPHLAAQYAGYRSWDAAQKIEVDTFIQTHCVVGDPAAVVERLRTLEALGITHVVLRLQFMGTPHAQTLAGIRRFGERVLPALGSATGETSILTGR